MDEITKISVDEFEKKSDGSWVSIKNSDIQTKTGKVIRISPGVPFKKGTIMWGIDVADALDRLTAN